MVRTNEAARRLVTLGASNLTRMLPALMELERARAPGPLDVYAALGFGRSYGIDSRFLARELPGIDGCGLWAALDAAPPAPSLGLVMDVGNDILYGVDVPAITAWVDRALARLRPRVDRLVVAGLPLPRVRRVGALRYALVRTVLVPSCKVARADALARAERLHDALRRLAAQHGADFVSMREEWYGFDPIHVRLRRRRAACAALLGVEWPAGRTAAPLRRWRRALQVHLAKAARRRLFGCELTTGQPARRWPDGSRLWSF